MEVGALMEIPARCDPKDTVVFCNFYDEAESTVGGVVYSGGNGRVELHPEDE